MPILRGGSRGITLKSRGLGGPQRGWLSLSLSLSRMVHRGWRTEPGTPVLGSITKVAPESIQAPQQSCGNQGSTGRI